MIEALRFIERDGKKTLQARTAQFQSDASGAICGHTTEDWQDIPLADAPVPIEPTTQQIERVEALNDLLEGVTTLDRSGNNTQSLCKRNGKCRI